MSEIKDCHFSPIALCRTLDAIMVLEAYPAYPHTATLVWVPLPTWPARSTFAE